MTELGKQITELRAAGMTYKQIGEHLNVSAKTVRYWLNPAFRKKRAEGASRRNAKTRWLRRDETLERKRLRALAAADAALTARATAKFMQARTRAEDRGRKFDVAEADIRAMLECGVCQRTGLRFEHRGPLAMSLDRIDNADGYTLDNLQAVCWIYNRAKGADTDAAVLRMAVALVSKTLVDTGMSLEELKTSVEPIDWD